MKIDLYIDNMINWALNKLGDNNYNGFCLSFVEDALEKSNNIEIFGGDSAKESYELYKDELNKGEPKRGSFVFYDCMCFDEEKNLVNYGHVGICIGEGKVIHAFDLVRIDNYVDIEKLVALTGDRPKYLGWVKIDRVLKQKRSQAMNVRGLSPIFPTPDIKKTAEYYVNYLGFRAVEYLNCKEPHICLYLDKSEIILTQSNKNEIIPNRKQHGYGEDAYLYTDDQEELEKLYKEKGVKIVKPLCITDYQNKEFVIEDIDGRWLAFGLKQLTD